VVRPASVPLAAGIAQLRCADAEFKAALHVLREYGNDGSHFGSLEGRMHLVKDRCDVLVVLGSMAAYAYDRFLQL
jgi:hypothetical protein